MPLLCKYIFFSFFDSSPPIFECATGSEPGIYALSLAVNWLTFFRWTLSLFTPVFSLHSLALALPSFHLCVATLFHCLFTSLHTSFWCNRTQRHLSFFPNTCSLKSNELTTRHQVLLFENFRYLLKVKSNSHDQTAGIFRGRFCRPLLYFFVSNFTSAYDRSS